MEQSNHRRIAATSLEPADCVKPEISGNRSCVRSFAKAATEQTAAAEPPPSDRRRHSNHVHDSRPRSDTVIAGPSMSGAGSDLTHVELVWVEKRIQHWIRFGRTAEEQMLDHQWRPVSFTPGSIFAFVPWTANDYGTVISNIDILRAIGTGERYATVPHVRPAESLLRLSGWPKVEKALQTIHAVKAMGIDPTDVAPDLAASPQPAVRRRASKIIYAYATRPDLSGARWRRDPPFGHADYDVRGRRTYRAHAGFATCASIALERIREHAHRALSRAADRHSYCRGARRCHTPEPLAAFLARRLLLPRDCAPQTDSCARLPRRLARHIDGIVVRASRERDRWGPALLRWDGC